MYINFRRKAAFFCILLAISLLLCACGVQTGGKSSSSLFSADETGEFYSSGRQSPNSNPEIPENTAFTEFCDRVFADELSSASTLDLHYTVWNPEAYGIANDTVSLGNFSLEDMIAGNEAQKNLLTELEGYDRNTLAKDQQILYGTLKETLESSLLGEGLELYEQPLAPTIGLQAQLPILLSEYSFHSMEDVENYLTLLSQIDAYYQELLDFEQLKADAGLAPSDASIDSIIKSCESYRIDPEENFLTETFDTRLSALSETVQITESQKEELRSRHLSAIRDHFIPAYEALITGMESLKGKGIRDGGLCELADGKKYYEYLLKTGPGLSYTVPQLKEALIGQMEEDLNAISLLFAKNPDMDIQNAAFRLTDPQEILADLKLQMAEEFPPCPDSDFEIRYVPKYLEDSLSPAFYLTAPVDHLDHNVIYINNGYSDSTDSLYTTLAHEGFPGHLYQTVYSRQNASHPLAAILSASGANEGWATYAENCACLFDNGLPEGVGEYRARARSFSLCVHGLLDIGINYEGWTMEEAGAFIRTYFDVDEETVMELWQTMIDNPTNYLDYCGGYVEIMEMRREAEAALGERFSPLEFHRFLLDLGPVPFSVTRSFFSQWLADWTNG